jgi:endonuclease/exonuclease/phosphatase family metal-dependent hydrolase
MANGDDPVNRPFPGSLSLPRPRTGRVRRGRNLAILVLALCIVFYTASASRRIPVEPQRGIGISWPHGTDPMPKTCFRVATYNIHRGKGSDGVRDLRRTADVLRDADLVGLNEVGGPAFWERADQVEQLADILQTGWHFAPNEYRWHRPHFGDGLLSRLAVARWTSVPLDYDEARSHNYRSLLTAEFVAGGRPITFMVTHLDRGPIRSVQLRHTLGEFAAHTRAVLVGDLNTRAADPILAAFFGDANNVDAVAQVLGATDSPDRVDWIITRGMKVLSGGMEPNGVSDHPCYWVDVEPLTGAGPGSPGGSSNL